NVGRISAQAGTRGRGMRVWADEADVAEPLKREGLVELLETSPHSPQHSPQQKSVTFDPCGADTLVLPSIHSLSITDTTEQPEIQNKTLSIQEPQSNDRQTQSQETSGNEEVTPDVTFEPSQISLVVESEVIKDETQSKTKDNVQPMKESPKTSTGAKRTFSSKNRTSITAKSASSSIKPSSSSPKCVSSSETSSLRKLVPLRQPSSSAAPIQVRHGRNVLNIPNVPKKTQAVRPEEKMCRATLHAADRPSSTIKPPSFIRNTVASTTRQATAPGNQPKPAPLTRAASLRLSQVHKLQQTPTGSARPTPPAGRQRKSSSATSENSALTRGSRDKNVKATWK
ncbi:hypothetical protein M9458_054667, partial [Cirrhinus mrigala]